MACSLLLVGLVLNLFLRQSTRLTILSAVNAYLVLGALISLVTYFRVRLTRLATEEAREQQIAHKERPESALFSSEAEAEPFTMARSRDQFERFVVPLLAPVLAMLQVLFAWRLYAELQSIQELPTQHLLAAAFLAGQAFAFFLLSRYTIGLSRAPEHRLLRGPGVYFGLACFACLTAVVAAILPEAGIVTGDTIVIWILLGSLTLLGAENVLNTLGQIYKPRRSGAEPNTAYESRIGALLTDPGAWVKNIAQAVDYQFGFNVSETWFYRFLAHALLPLIAFQIIVLYLLSCFVFLGPQEQGILEHLGKAPAPTDTTAILDSGFHIKWPWPFETVRRYPTKLIQSLHVGHRAADGEHPNAMLWTVPHHASKETFLVASRDAKKVENDQSIVVPVNMLSIHMPVQYRVTNVYQYAYHYANPSLLLEQVAFRTLSREAVSRGLFDFIGEGQLEAARNLQERIQAESDQLQIGIQIEFVGLQGLHPPVAVADAFESVIGAMEEKEAAILQAQAYTNRILPLAHADATALGSEAIAIRKRRVDLAAAEAYQFEKRLEGYGKSPDVFKTDIYLRTLRDALIGTRKYIISAVPANEVIQFDFQEKANPDLFDFGSDLNGERR